jgi:hypothetical protein
MQGGSRGASTPRLPLDSGRRRQVVRHRADPSTVQRRISAVDRDLEQGEDGELRIVCEPPDALPPDPASPVRYFLWAGATSVADRAVDADAS